MLVLYEQDFSQTKKFCLLKFKLANNLFLHRKLQITDTSISIGTKYQLKYHIYLQYRLLVLDKLPIPIEYCH